MNNKRRAIVKKAGKMLVDAYDLIDTAYEEELESLDSIPERLQSGDRYDKMSENVEYLEEAKDQLETVIDALREVLQ